MPITINGTGSITGISAGGLPDGSVTADDLATSVSLGKILQIVQTSKTDTTSTTSQDSFTDLGLSASITPASTSNKVLVMVSIGRVTCNTTANRTCPFRVLRGSTPVGVGDTAGNRLTGNFVISDTNAATDNGHGGAYQFLDSPSTTSSTTYKIQWSGQAGETWYLNRSGSDTDNVDAVYTRTGAHIILMEVEG